jgi:[ribosomal protein S18]-alanine N-acetyltransferase
LKAGDLVIANCKITDLSEIQRIENSSFDDPYSPMVFWSLYLGPKRIFRVLRDSNKIVAYSVAKLERSDQDGAAHLISLAVDPLSRGKGIGSKLLEDVILQTKNADPKCKKMELEVRTDNQKAIGLYQKFGFRQIGTISNYYGKGRHAWLMELDYAGN